MSQDYLPKVLKYKNIKPKGLPSSFKRWEVNPMASQQSYSVNDLIRFQFSTDKFIDPYGVYFEIQVEVPISSENQPSVCLPDNNINPITGTYLNVGVTSASTNFVKRKFIGMPDVSTVPAYLLDGNAGAFISETILYSNGREVERQQEYDQLSNIIQDFGVNGFTRSKQQYSGLKFNQQSNTSISNQFQFNNLRNFQNTFSSIVYTGSPSINTSSATGAFSALSANLKPLYNPGFNYSSHPSDTSVIKFDYTQYQSSFDNSLPSLLPQSIEMSTLRQIGSASAQCNAIANYTTMASKFLYLAENPQNNKGLISGLNMGTQTAFNLNQNYNFQKSVDPQYYPIQNLNNYAREFALTDENQMVDHFNTLNGTLIQEKIWDAVKISQDGTAGNDKRPFATYSEFLKDPDTSLGNFNYYAGYDINYESLSKSAQLKKRVIFNQASSYNSCDYIIPGEITSKWKNGKALTNVVFGSAQTSTDNSTTAALIATFDGNRNTVKNTPILNPLQETYATTTKTYYIPFLSGVLGHLIPQDQWKLIPGEGCGTLNLELRLNRFAMWMSGHKLNYDSGTPVDLADNLAYQFHNGKTSNGWNIKKISLHLDLWDFDKEIKEQVRRQLENGVLFSSQTFNLGPTYSVSSTSQLKGSWQINNNLQSVKHLYLWFLDDSYQKYNFCRKQFRLSHNMKSLQLKAGSEYIPEMPIQGSAGDLVQPINSTNGTYFPFYMELQRCHQELFSADSKLCIMPQSYVVNQRAYDPWDNTQSMGQTALLHETRLNGKAIFCLDFEADPFDSSILSGKNIGQYKPVDLILDVNTGADFTRPSTMYMFLHADMLVNFTKDGIQTVI